MSARLTFDHICSVAAARRCYDAGQSVAEIAKAAKKSESTIRKWLEEIGVCLANR